MPSEDTEPDENAWDENTPVPPGKDVTDEMYIQWRTARRSEPSVGTTMAQDVTNPYWLWLFRTQIDPYTARESFFDNLITTSGPAWAGNRMGMSTTYLSDGRTVWIAGEHEDHYDPDFFIYNDVIIRDAKNQDIRIYAYSEDAFPPTDFHSATPYENETKILLIGGLDYPSNRKIGSTRVQSLDLSSLAITQIQTSGQGPGWIHHHKAVVDPDGAGVTISGGKIDKGNLYLENINEWHLSFSDWSWTQLTDRKWIRFEVQRKDEGFLHLFNYGSLKFDLECRDLVGPEDTELAKELGIVPLMDLYEKFYVPSIAHRPFPTVEVDIDIVDDVEEDDESSDEVLLPDSLLQEMEVGDDEWCTHRILVDDVCVRFCEGGYSVMATVEGELPKRLLQSIAEEILERLSRLENAECELVWHRPK